jgi:hypothetical protein
VGGRAQLEAKAGFVWKRDSCCLKTRQIQSENVTPLFENETVLSEREAAQELAVKGFARTGGLCSV